MNIEKLPSGNYRVRKTVNGKTYRITFDHKPSEKEIIMAFSEKITDNTVICEHITFRAAVVQYCNVKSNVLSPSTIRDYLKIPNRISSDFVDKYLEEITPNDVQYEINKLSAKLSPKTVRNIHGFISTILGYYRPDFRLSTTLPQKRKFNSYTPSKRDVDRILDYAKGTPYSIPFQLGALGLRRSEIAGLKKTDLDGNYLTIHTAVVQDKDDNWVDKGNTKTTESTRTIWVSDELAEEIRECNKICEVIPDTLGKTLSKWQDRLGIPHFRFHDLRVYYVSYAHACGIPDKIPQKNGGWKTDYVMKSTYQKTISEEELYFTKALAEDILKINLED